MADLNSFVVAGIGLVCVTTIYCVALITHRLVFSPLAGFPGPKLAAATGWVEFYYDFFKQGAYIYEIEKMHKKYGIPCCGSTIVITVSNIFIL